MKKSIERQLLTNKNRRRDIGAKRRNRLSRRALRHEVLEARQLLDANSLTFVLDFVESNQGQLVDKSGNAVAPFDASSFGFAPGDESQIANAVLAQVRAGFLSIPDAGENVTSPLASGQELDIDIYIGDVGQAPINGASEYYTLLIGNTLGGVPLTVGTTLQNDVRDGAGNPNTALVGSSIGSVFVDNISSQFPAGTLTPADALTSGDLTFTSRSIANSVLHELGQVLTLTDVQTGGAHTLGGLSPVMGVLGASALDSQPQEFISTREFALTAISPEAGGAVVNPLQTLINNIGTRDKVGLPVVDDAGDGPQLIGINPDAGSLFASTQDFPSGTGSLDLNTLSSRNLLNVAPSELTLRFASDDAIDEATLASGIEITRSVDGIFGNGNDITITPGYLGLDDTQRIVIARFSETLPDDSYRVRVFGFDDVSRDIEGVRTVSTGQNVGGLLFEPANINGMEIDGVNDSTETLYFELELGAQVVAVVPQPIGRNAAGDLIQNKNQIVVYFNDDDLAATAVTTSSDPAVVATQPRVVQPDFYQLILTNETVSGNDDVVVLPTSISYDPSLDRAVLTFDQYSDGSTITDLGQIPVFAGNPSGAATFRLRVGSSDEVASRDHVIRPVEVDPAVLRFTGTAADINFVDPAISLLPRDQMTVSLTDGTSVTFEFTDSGTTVPNLPIVINAGMTNEQVRDAILAALESHAALQLSPLATLDGIAIDIREGQVISSTNPRLGVSSDVGSSFAGADTLSLGALTGATSTLIRQEIRALDSYALEYPGGFDEQGLRDFDQLSHFTFQNGDEFDGLQGSAISRLYYNFNTSLPYGQDGFGQNLSNAITEAQKQRTREIFEVLGQNWGIDFVETDSHRVNGVDGVSLTIVTGNLVVAGVESGPGGVFGALANTPQVAQQAHTFGRTVVLMDAGESWFNESSLPDPLNASRLSYYAHAMNLIMSGLGVQTASEAPPGTVASGVIRNYTLGGEENLLAGVTYANNGVANLTGVNPVEPVLPGDIDNVLGQHLYRPESRDIDVYRFEVAEAGVFTAETFAERLNGSASLLDSYLSVYRNNNGVQELVARNDNYYGEDAFIELNLEPGEYFLAVSAAGNEAFDLALADSGMGGTSEGTYELLVNFAPKSVSQIVDTRGTAIDGDGDGTAGGEFNFWFRSVLDEGGVVGQTPTLPRTLYVDKSHATSTALGQRIGTLENPYNNIQNAFAAARPGDTVRIVGNGGLDGNVTTLGDNFAYEIGRGGSFNLPLSDGATMEVPQGVHVQIDAGAIFKLKDARIVAGSSSSSVDLSGGSLQVLGTPFYDPIGAVDTIVGLGNGEVRFTSYLDQTIGVDTNSLYTEPASGNWGGIEFKNNVDNAEGRANLERQGIFLNYVGHADFQYGGGRVTVNSQSQTVNPIHLSAARPTLLYNEIQFSADAAISADGDSFLETNFNSPLYQRNDAFVSDYDRVGPDIRGNVLQGNSTNGLFVRVDTPFGQPTQQLVVPARFDDTDIVHVIGENLLIQGTPGGPILQSTPPTSTGVVSSAAANAASTLAAGAYTYRITYVDRFGGESLPSDATSVVNVVAGQQVSLSGLPAATGDFVARRLYRSQPGGGGVYDLVAELDRSRTTYVDRGGSLGATLNTLAATAEPNVDSTLAAGTHVYRVGLLNDDPNLGQTEVVFSDVINVTTTVGQQVRFDNLAGLETSSSPITQLGALNTGFSGETQFRVIYRLNTGTGQFDVVGLTSLNQTSFVDDGTTLVAGTLTGVQPADMPVINATRLRARPDARLAIDPGIIVKMDGARIETGYGAQLIAEGTDGQQVRFTSSADDRFGAGGSFDTNGDLGGSTPVAGDWGGIHIGPLGSVSIDHAYIAYAGGVVETGGTFAGFNALEIIQADGRVANSTFEHNASGLGGQAGVQRDGHGFNEPAVIFVRGSQPVIVDNVIQKNSVGLTAAISINVNALNSEIVLDQGRQTGVADNRTDVRNNFGPLIDGNRLGDNSINGLAVRGGTLTTEVVWDDTDIVHVVDNFRPDMQGGPELIQIPDLFSFGGLRLQSDPQESLVVKFGAGAEIIATGRPLDIEDRVGGSLHVLGAPGFPVVLTSLTDDTVGAGFDPLGQALSDTNGDGAATSAAAGDWQGLVLDKFSNDRNVETVNEIESPDRVLPLTAAGNNANPSSAEFLGALASSETSSDENLRLGFTVHGVISRPSDVDVYSFNAAAGTEVWIDIDRTSFSLDTVVEVININGDIIALSDNSHSESTQTTTLLANENLLPADRVNVLQRDPFGPTNSIDGSFRDDYTTNLFDAGMRLTLPGSAGTTNTFFVRVRSNNQDSSDPQPRDIQNDPSDGIAFENDLVGDGRTSGTYQLQVRIGEQQEHGGSTIRQAEIRYATAGIEVRGLPLHSPLLGEASEPMTGTSDGNDTIGGSIDLGSLNATDRAALSAAGQIFDLSGSGRTDDVDWFEFQVASDSVDPLGAGALHTPVVIDVDYADGLARPNTSIWLFGRPDNSTSPAGEIRLLAFGTDSNILDDQGAPNQGVDQDDLSRGSGGPLDAWLGTMELNAGNYYVAVTNNSRISDQLEQFQTANPSNPLTRVEPITSVQRISSDHDFDDNGVQDNYFGFGGNLFPTTGAATATPPVTVAFDGNSNRIDYTLSDVVLYVTTSTTLSTYDPFTGIRESVVSNSTDGGTVYSVRDIAMRPDGNLYGFGENGAINDANYDSFLRLSTEGGDSEKVGDAGIETYELNDAGDAAARARSNSQSTTARNGDGLSFEAITYVGANGNSTSLGQNADDLALISVSQRADSSVDALHDTNWIFRHNPSNGTGISTPSGDRTNANGVVDGPGPYESGTEVVERGYINTDIDEIANTQSAIINVGSAASILDTDLLSVMRFGTTATLEFDAGLSIDFDLNLGMLSDGDLVSIDDSNGGTHLIEIDTGVILQASQAGGFTNISDGDTLTVTTASGFPIEFEFDSDSTLNDRNRIAINFQATDSPATIAAAVATAVNLLDIDGLSAVASADLVDITGEQSITVLSSGLTTIGAAGIVTAGAIPLSINAFASSQQIAEAFGTFEGVNFGFNLDSVANGSSATFAGATAISVLTASATYMTVSGDPLTAGVQPGNLPVAMVVGESEGELATRLAEFLKSINFDVDQYGTKLVAVDGFFNHAGISAAFDVQDSPGGGEITGLASVETNAFSGGGDRVELFAVSEFGDLYRVVGNTGGSAFQLGSSSNRGDYIATLTDASGNAIRFSGLTVGPRNLEEGRLSETLFGVATDGTIYAFDTMGRPQAVFANGQTSLRTNQSGVTGLAFSNLDVNLWHVSNSSPVASGVASDQDGVGVDPSPDGNTFRNIEGSAGGNHLYFGFENPRSSGNDIQTGEWDGIYDIGNTGIVGDYSGDYLTYNFPGGALGSMESNPLDLSAYSSADRPALYFNYYLETENANDDLPGDSGTNHDDWMLDSLRVFAAGEDGVWRLLATNNSDRSDAGGSPDGFNTNAGLNPRQPQAINNGSSDEFDELTAGGTDLVQELYDVGDNGAPDSWRQARVSLDDFAGQSGVRIRFDFSTAGSMGIGDPFEGGEELRAVAGSQIADGQTMRLRNASNFSTTTFEFDSGLELRIPSAVSIPSGEYLQIDGHRFTFQQGGAEVDGDGVINFSLTDTPAMIAGRLQAELLSAGLTSYLDTTLGNRLSVAGVTNSRGSVDLPTGMIVGQPGVAVGNTPVFVHSGMTAEEVALAVQKSFAEALNVTESQDVTASYPIRNGYLIKVYGYNVLDSGPLGLSQHGSGGNALPGDEFGQFASSSLDNSFRAQNNAFRGVYLDDIIVGFRERGEMVINSQADQTAFVNNLDYEPVLRNGVKAETDLGYYQVEIRIGADYGTEPDGFVRDLYINRTFDTNDRLATAVSLNAPSPDQVYDGQTFTLSDGTNTVTFEFDDTTILPGQPGSGVTAGNVRVPFDPSGTMSRAALGRSIRDAINGAQAQETLAVSASMSDGSVNGSTTVLGSPSNSHVISLHGVVAVDNFGSSNFADLNNQLPTATDAAGNLIPDDYILHGVDIFNSVDGGDRNRKRDQGQILLQGNVITDALTYGINIIPGDRDTAISPLAGTLPHAGPPRATQEFNDERLAPGVSVFNNIVVASGTAGIRISGEATDDAAVPMARIVNNTVYGTGSGIGIQVENNAGPTLSNNIVANVTTGVQVDSSSNATTEISTSLYYRTGTASTYRGGDLGTSSVLIADATTPVFVDPDNRNFYPVLDSPAIDSSREVITDRSYMLTIKGPLGIGASPIVAPNRDVTGQFRTDDPNSPSSGTGQNVFKDLGAFERSDFDGPVALLITPQDNDSGGQDKDPNDTYVQWVQGTLNVFEILISDINGTGPDVATIDPDFGPAPDPNDPAIDLSAVSITENGRLLTEGVDYSLGFSPTNSKILLTPLTGIWRPESIYEITLNNRDRMVLTAPAGSEVQDGDQIQIVDENGVEATLEFDSGYVLVVPQTLTIVVPANGGSGVQDGETFTINDAGTLRVFELNSDSNVTASRTRVDFAVSDTATQLRDKILTAMTTLLASLPANETTQLQPVAVSGDKIQIGNSPSIALTTTGDTQLGLSQQGVAAGVTDGQLISVTHPGGSTVFEFDTDAVSTIAADHRRIPIQATATHEQIAAAIAQAVRSAGVGLDSARDLGQGVVQLGGTSAVTVDVTNSTLVPYGTPGVEESLQLTVPVDSAGFPTVSDGTSFTLTVGAATVRYEFNDLNVNPATTPGTQVIGLTKPDPVNPGLFVLRTADELAVEIASVIQNSSLDLEPTATSGGVVELNEPLGTTFDLNNSGLVASGVAGGAIPVAFSPLNFTSSQMALELVRAINGIDIVSDPNDGPFVGLASLRGSDTLFLSGVTSVVDANNLLGVSNVSAIRDIAGNALSPNRANSETQFTILTPGLSLDFGDAPFASLLADNGARHVVVDGSVYLGTVPTTTETDANAVGTSADGDAAEDGVDFTEAFFSPYYTSSVIHVSVQGDGVLDGWVDFNRDGDFDDVGEQVVSMRQVSTGTETIALAAPSLDGFVPGLTYARFRVSQTGGLSSTGVAVGGEVEDYLVENLAGRPPVANPGGVVDAYTTAEDTPLSVATPSLGILQNDGPGLSIFDADSTGFPKQIEIGGGAVGAVQLNSDGTFNFTPAENFYGTGTFTYRAFNGVMPSNELGTVTLTVTPVNDEPVAVDDPAGTPAFRYLEDQVVRIPWSVLLANDGGFPANEAALENLRISSVAGITPSLPGTPTVPVTVRIIDDSSTTEPMVEIIPQQHSVGIAQFIYHVTDDGTTDGSADPKQSAIPATVTLEFLKVNDAPVPDEAAHAGLNLTVSEDLPYDISIDSILNDDDPAPNRISDRDIFELTYQEVVLSPDAEGLFPGGIQLATENGGTAVLVTDTAGDLVIRYTPPSNFFGTDAIFYRIGDVDTATNGFEPPASAPQSGLPQSYLPTTAPADPNNPPANYLQLADGSWVRLQDDAKATVGRITLTVTPVNDAPVIATTQFETLEDTPVVFSDALASFGIADGPNESGNVTISATGNITTTTQGGTIAIVGNQLTYTPPANFFGLDVLRLTLTDSANPALNTDVEITATVRPVNDAPFDPTAATPTVVNAIEDNTNLVIDLAPLFTDKLVNQFGTDESTDPDNVGNVPQSLVVQGVRLGAGAPSGAAVSLLSNGSVRVTLPQNYFTEIDAMTSAQPPLNLIYTLSDQGISYVGDGSGGFVAQSDPKTVDVPLQLKVFPVNDAPVGRIHRLVNRVSEDTPVTLDVSELIPTDGIVAGLNVGQSLPGTFDSAGPNEDLGGNAIKDTAGETLSQHLAVRSPNSGSNVITTSRGGTVEFIDTDNDTTNGFEQVLYTPPLNFASSSTSVVDTFTYTIQDDGATFTLDANGNPVATSSPLQATGTVEIQVTPVNDPPQFVIDENVSVSEDTTLYDPNDPGHVTLSGFVKSVRPGPADALDEVSQNVRFEVTTTNPGLFDQKFVDESGVVTQRPDISISAAGDLEFNLQLNQNGSAVVTVVAIDDDPANPLQSTSQQFTITVGAVNDPPEFGYPNAPDAPLTIQVAEGSGFYLDSDWASPIAAGPASALDEQSQSVRFNVTTDRPELFVLEPSITSAGALRFTPAPNQHGEAVVTVTAVDTGPTGGDNISSSQPVVLTISIVPVNDIPVPVNDTYAANENALLEITGPGVVANDTDFDGDVLYVNAFGGMSPGVLTGTTALGATVTFAVNDQNQAEGGFIYDPTGSATLDRLTDGESLVDSFTYQVVDETGVVGLTAGRVSITVAGRNDAPRLVNNAIRVASNRVTIIDVLDLVEDPEASGVDAASLAVTLSALNGTLTNNGDGTLSYNPRENFKGSDSFQFTIADVEGNRSTSQTLMLEVGETPISASDVVRTSINRSVDIDVLANDQGVAGVLDPTSLRITTQPAEAVGRVEVQANGIVRFTPANNFVGTAQFRYTVADEFGVTSDPASVVVLVSLSAGQNSSNIRDVNGSGEVSPIDALIVINHLNKNISNDVETLVDNGTISISDGPFMDVNGDGVITPIDALTVINYLNGVNGLNGEYQSLAAPDISSVVVGAAGWMQPEVDEPEELTPEAATVIALGQLVEEAGGIEIDPIIDELADSREDQPLAEELDEFWSNF
ncbi:Dockerin type I repeat protein [Rosistilla carotiformis]|uniref:Dockerin type I repeat protein n=1 Tax=Rosistilla carotiformis TaxID=2528017 RepID=A0A518K0B6_9BACT|nr:Ig-like domain-containing protein [Rosistilla carotiformis]QDV71228.1 Dockerin type I repeat protein [Rosistilla carotiformis]